LGLAARACGPSSSDFKFLLILILFHRRTPLENNGAYMHANRSCL
jgi:hypothetical protein